MMKKLFSGGTGDHTGWIGKQFQVGRYLCTVESLIAEGGFALVFVVRTQSGQRCALKRTSVNEEVDLAVCRQEVNILKSLTGHKNAITFLDAAITNLEPGIYEVLMLMEFCKAGSVIDLMNENINSGFNESLVLKIFCDTCEAVSLLHNSEPPILHRDLKVENVLRKESGDFVLCDFGSARRGSLDPNRDGIREVEDDIQKYTTVAYRAPEMIDLYAGHIIDTKADIWALGCLLYKLCFFTSPFGESTLAIQGAQFTIPEDSRYSKEMHSLIRYTLNPEPTKRPNIYQVSFLAFKMANKPCPVPNKHNSRISQGALHSDNVPVKDNTETRSQTTTQSSSGPVLTSVAPRGRPVTTSLAPRQRPKGNNQIIEGQEDTSAAFKHSSQQQQQQQVTSNLQRSGSLNQISNMDQQQHRPVYNQLSHQYQQFQGNQQQLTQQEVMMQQQQYIQQQQQQLNYYQQVHQQQLLQQQQQQDMLVRQQQEMEMAARQQQQQEMLVRQQQEMEMAARQQQLLQQQQAMQHQQQEMVIRQQQELETARQQQQLQQQQQQKEEYVRQRHEQYQRLQKLREEEEQAKIRMQKIMIQKQKLLDDDFNPRGDLNDPRLCHSVEPTFNSRDDDKGGRSSPNPFEDDFSQSSPDLSNPFQQRASDDNFNPFAMKKKTHHRSRSDTFTRLAAKRADGLHPELHSGKQPSPRLSPIPAENVKEPLTVDTIDASTDGPNPFKTGTTSVESGVNADNPETGILLELAEEDDEHFNQLQRELETLGVMKDVDRELEHLGIEPSSTEKPKSPLESARGALDISRNDGSPLLSSSVSPQQVAHGERKYVYKRTSSCSSSNESASSSDSEDAGEVTHAYQDCNSEHVHQDSASEIVNVNEQVLDQTAEVVGHAWSKSGSLNNVERDIFDSAPFAPSSLGGHIKRQKAKKDKLHGHDHKPRVHSPKPPRHHRSPPPVVQTKSPENPFDEFVANRNATMGGQVPAATAPPGTSTATPDNDPFGMAPLKLPKTKKRPVEQHASKVKSSDPFNMAPMKMSSTARKPAPSSVVTDPFSAPQKQGDDPFGSAPFVPSARGVKQVNKVPGNERKKRVLPTVPVQRR